MSEELYKKYRPSSFNEVVGQPDALKSLNSMGKAGTIPHTLLFTGPSGCGKTTIARILRNKLKCSDIDFFELNASDSRGIDTIREIKSQIGSAPLGGTSRIWLIDEAHALTGDAQNAFLKILEDTPKHVYFFLATTDPQKLKKTIITRCTEIRCKLIDNSELEKLVRSVAEKEEIEISTAVASKIAVVAEGSARKALVLLHSVINIKDEDSQLAAIEANDATGQGIEIARALISTKTSWPEMQAIIKKVDEEPETIRYIVLGYMNAVMLGNGNHKRASLIIENFRDNWYDCKKAGLVISCYNVING